MNPGSQKREETSLVGGSEGVVGERRGQPRCLHHCDRSGTLDEVKGVSLRPRADRTVAPVSNIQVTKRTE